MAQVASETAAPSFVVAASEAVANGISCTAGWVRENPVGGLVATAAVGVGLGYLTYKAFSNGKE